eukprot:jgi/Tetstr1/427067/TSEL_017272.t1
MGVGEDPVGEDGMDIDAPAWLPAGVEAADEGVIREGDPGDFYMKVIAKKFRGVWHYGVITGVVTEWVLDLLRSEVVEAMAAAHEHPPVDADGEARMVTVPEGDDLFAQQINRMKAHRLYREPNPNKKGYMALDDAGPGAVETPIRLVGSASAAWEDAVDFKDHLKKLLDDVRRTVQGSHSYAPILARWGAVLPGWTPSGGAGGLLAYKAASLRNGDKPRLHRGGGVGETSRDTSFFVYKMLKQVPDADPPPYTTEELESEEELPRNLLAERDDAKYTTMVARAQHFYLATPPPPPGADSDDSRASARPIRAALYAPGIRKVVVLMAPADMFSAKAADLGVDAGELLVAGIHARSQDGASSSHGRASPPATAPSAVADAVVAGCCEEVALDIASAGLGVCRWQSCEAMDTVRDAKSG